MKSTAKCRLVSNACAALIRSLPGKAVLTGGLIAQALNPSRPRSVDALAFATGMMPVLRHLA